MKNLIYSCIFSFQKLAKVYLINKSILFSNFCTSKCNTNLTG